MALIDEYLGEYVYKTTSPYLILNFQSWSYFKFASIDRRPVFIYEFDEKGIFFDFAIFFFIFRMFSNKEESIASDATSCFSGRRLLHTTQSFSLDKTYLFFRILIRRTNTANSIYFMFLHLTLEFCIHHHLMCFRHLISQYQHWDRGLDLTKFWSKSDSLCFQKAYAF